MNRERFALDVSLEVPAGTCLALAGPSGAGKSTVLRTISGLVEPDEGRVACDGDVWLDTAASVNVPPERRRCGHLFQDYALFPHLRAWQNVAYGLGELPRGERRRRALELLDRFGIAHLAHARPPTLSGGERQRVALARALAREPRALLLDEPLSALDARTRGHAGRELAGILRDAGVPAVLVTHDFSEAALLGDEVGVIDGGRVVQRGTAADLAAKPASAFVADFAGANILTGIANPTEEGLTAIDLDGGGMVTSTERLSGRVAVAVFPWDVAIEAGPPAPDASPVNHLRGPITSLTQLGNRTRVAIATPQLVTAEITTQSIERLQLRKGDVAVAAWKATATRLIPQD